MSIHLSQKELESYLWGAATLLRGLIDASDYKQYIFPLLFFKRLSDVWDEDYREAFEDSQDEGYAQTLAGDAHVAGWPLVFLVDDTDVVERTISFLWSTFTRFEPAGDIHAAGSRTHRHHEILEAPIVFDCRMKPGYPDELFADDDTVNKVSRRWAEYFPEGNVEGEADPLGCVGFRRMR